MRKFGFYFSELIVTTGIYVLLIVYFTAKDYIFSPYNREISGVILLLFGIGIAMVIHYLRKLYREDQQISLFFDQLENFRIALNQLLQKRQTLSPEMTTNTFRKIVDEHFAILYPSLFKERIYKIVNITLADRKPDQDTLSSLLQQKVEMGGNRIRYIAGILIMIGLLGTFLGLVQAIKYLQHFFTASEGVDLTMLFSDMKQSLGGLDKAFGTSIGGITAYLVLGYLNIVVRTKQSDILNRIEEATLEHIIPSIQKFRIEKKPQDVPSATAEMLQTIPESVSKHLKTALESVIRQTIGGSTEHLQATSAHLQQAAEGIQKGQDIFTQTLNAFENFLTTFQEDKEQLLSIQQTLASGVQAFSQEITVLKDNQQMLASSLETMKEYMANSETRLSSMDDVVQQMHTIWTDNRQVFEKLAETIQNEHNALTQILQRLEEFLQSTRTESLAYFQHAQEGVNALVTENMEVHRELLESHTMLTTLLHDVKTFILDEQKGLSVLSTSLHDTFEEARFQYLQLTEQFAELYKRLLENQEQLAQTQEAAAIQQMQRRHNA